MAFTILNESASVVYVLSGKNRYPQAEVDKVDIDILAQAANGEGVLSGCAVTAKSPESTSVAVASGNVQKADGSSVAVAAGDVNCGAAHATLPRFDLIIANLGTGAKSVVNGTATDVPVFPTGAAVLGTSVVLASIWRAAADDTIAAADIVDKRAILAAMYTDAKAVAAAQTVKLDDFTAPDDNTDLNASTSKHGLLPKLSNVATQYLNGTGAWSTPAGGGASTPYIIWGELVDNAQGADKFRMVSCEFQDQATKTFDKLVVHTYVALAGGDSVFTFRKNGASVGSVTVSNTTKRGESIVTNFTLTASDVLSVDKDSGADEGTVTQIWVIEADNTS